MGDYGKIYSTYTDEMCGLMKELVAGADIITPNITESCILTDTPYSDMLYEKRHSRTCRKTFNDGT